MDNTQDIKVNLKYLVLPDYAYEDNRLSALQLKLYAFINTFKGKEFYFSRQHLATMFNISEWSITMAMKGLESYGYISTEYKIKANGGKVRFVKNLKQLDPSSELSLTQVPKTTLPKFVYMNDNKLNDNNINAKQVVVSDNTKKWKRKPLEEQTQLQRIVYLLEDTLKTSIVNWGKQAKALKLMLQAGYTEKQIIWTIKEMAKEDFFQEKGFDLMTVANNIDKYKIRAKKLIHG